MSTRLGAGRSILAAVVAAASIAMARAQSEAPAPAEETASTEAPADDGVMGSVVVGGETIDDLKQSSKFQEFRELPNGFYLESLTFGLNLSDWTLDIGVVDLLQDDQQLGVTVRKLGKFRARLGYEQNPKWFSNTTATLFTGLSAGSLVLPAPMRQQLQASGTGAATSAALAGYLAASQPFDLRYRRETTLADLRFTPGNWIFGGEFSQEHRGGTRPLSMATYFSAGDITEIGAPVNYTTRNASASAEYATQRFHVGAEAAYSEFTDSVTGHSGGSSFDDALVVDNPLRFTDASSGPNGAAARFLISTPPDNTSGWINLTGGMRIGAWGRLAVQVSIGRNEQDSAFLPFSLNSAVPPPADPRGLAVLQGDLATGTPVTRYDGKVETFLHDVRFTGTPIHWLSFKVYSHSYDYDNQTPHYVVTDYIRGDTGLEGIARAALPFAWKRDSLGADVKLRPARELGLSVGYERESWDRHFRNTPQTSENIYKAGVDWRPGTWASVHFAFRHGDRTFDDYDEETFFGEESFPEGEPVANAIVTDQRLFDLANRTQNRADVMIEFTPFERFSFGLNVSGTRNEYGDTVLGRTEDWTRGAALDFAVVITDAVVLSADYGQERFQYDLTSRYRPVVAGVAVDNALNNWFSTIEDATRSYGLGVEATLVPRRWVLDAHASITDAKGKSDSGFVPGGAAAGDAVSFPEVTNTLTHLETNLRFISTGSLWVSVGYVLEQWDATDFARDVMQPFMGAVDPSTGESVFLGWRVPNYDVNIFRALVGCRF